MTMTTSEKLRWPFEQAGRILRRLFRRGLKLTGIGVLFLALTMLFGLAAINTGVNLLFLLVGMLLAFILISGLLSEIAFQRLAVRRRVPDQVHCGEWFAAHIEVKNRKRFLPTFSLWLEERPNPAGDAGLDLEHREGLIPFIAPGEMVKVTNRACFRQRGLQRFGAVRLKTRFPFGFFEKSTEVEVYSPVVVYPPIGTLLPPALSRGGDERRGRSTNRRFLDRNELLHGIRPYRPGDSPRLVDWKASQRHRSLMVKEFEPEEGRTARIVLDPYVPEGGSPDAFELGASLAATLLEEFSRHGDQATLWLCRQEGRPHRLPTGSGGQLEAALEALALAAPFAQRSEVPHIRSVSRSAFSYLLTCRPEAFPRAGDYRVIRYHHRAELRRFFEPPRITAGD